jgi:hypothetical protein
VGKDRRVKRTEGRKNRRTDGREDGWMYPA